MYMCTMPFHIASLPVVSCMHRRINKLCLCMPVITLAAMPDPKYGTVGNQHFLNASLTVMFVLSSWHGLHDTLTHCAVMCNLNPCGYSCSRQHLWPAKLVGVDLLADVQTQITCTNIQGFFHQVFRCCCRLWKEKCKECGIDETYLKSVTRRRPSGAIISNPWKSVSNSW